MAAKLEDRVLDLGINVLDTEADKLYVCSSQPTTFTEAITTFALGNKNAGVGSVCGSPAGASPNGRKTAVTAITGGSITASGTAAFWAIVDTVNSRLLAAGPLSAGVAVVNGDTFTLSTFDIAIPNQ